jgi:hypothetical protein
VRDHKQETTGEISHEGHACWHVINESTARKRRLVLKAHVRSGKAVWERAPAGSPCRTEIEIELELPRGFNQDYSEKFIPTAEGEEAIITTCQGYAQTLLSGFVISHATRPAPPPAAPTHAPAVRVFVSYSHHDAARKDSILEYLSGLEREEFEFWYDRDIMAGEIWNETIEEEIDRADIALVLVSQAFLNSQYCMSEVERFLTRRRNEGLIIFPIILSPCDWKSHPWLRTTQFEPSGGGSIEKDYTQPGRLYELYLLVLQQLREHGTLIRERRTGA